MTISNSSTNPSRKRRALPCVATVAAQIIALASPVAISTFGLPAPAFASGSEMERLAGYPVDSFRSYDPTSSRFTDALGDAARLISQGLKLERSGKSEGALVAFQQASDLLKSEIENLPRGLSDEGHFLIGYASELQGENERAVASYKQSLKDRARNPLVLFRLAAVEQKVNSCESSLRNLEEVRWMTDEFPHEVLFQISICQEQMGNVAGAYATLSEIEKTHPDFTPAKSKLTAMRIQGLDLTVTGRLNRSLATTVAADLQRAPDTRIVVPESELTLAKILVRKSDPLVNMDDLKRAEAIAQGLANKSNFQNDFAVRVLFDAQMKSGNRQEAERTVTRGLVENPNSETLLEAAQQLSIMKESGV